MLSPTCAALPAQDVFNIFLGALFGGTVLAELRTFLEDPSHIWCGSIAWLAELMTAPAASLLAWLHGTTQMHGQALQLSACPHAATLQQCNPSNHTPVFAAGLRWAAPSLPPPISSCEHLVLGRQRCVQARAVGGLRRLAAYCPFSAGTGFCVEQQVAEPFNTPMSALPTSPCSNYVCYRALVMSAFRLFYPHQVCAYSPLSLVRCAVCAHRCMHLHATRPVQRLLAYV